MKTSQTDARLAKLEDVAFKPLSALSALAVPPPFAVERRDNRARHELLRRICGEFEEMPGTCLTLPQATRLFGISPEICGRVLVGLVNEHRLRHTHDGRFRLRSTAA
jgi:hypothetical protein